MPVSPICLVADGLGPFVPTTGGVDVGPADTISIKLNDTTGVANWFLLVSGTDELSTPPTLTSVNPITNQVATPGTTVTFSYPNAQGRAILFTSTVTGPGGPVTTTFCIYSRTIGGKRVGAAGEEREGSTSFGWITILNPIIRVGASYLYYDDTLQAPASGSNTIQGVIDYLKTHGGGVTSVTGTAPIGSTGGTTPVISIAPATDLAAGSMSAADKTKLDGITAGAAVASVSGSSPIASSGGTTPTISFSIAGQAQGDVIYFDGANWVRLTAGTLGQFLETLGPGANPQWATASGGSSGPLGDNADAFRAGPFRNFLQGQVTAPQLVLNTGLLDEFDILSTTKSGSDLVLSGRRLFFAGTIAVAPQLMSGSSSVTASPTKIAKATASLAGAATVAADAYGPLTNAATQASGAESLASSSISASASVTHNASASLQGAATVTPGGQIYVPSNNITNAQLYSMDLGGYATAPEFNQTSQISLMKNPSALVGLYVNSRNFQALSVSSAGVLSNTFYDTIHSRSTDWTIKHTAPESWAGSRACYVYQDFGNGVLTTFFWTVPGGNKVYADNVSEEGLQTSLNIVASNPTGICADGSNNVWVSFVGLGRVRKYTVGQGPLTYFQLTQVLDITLANVVELMFDGKYIWALSTAGANGTIYKLDQSPTPPLLPAHATTLHRRGVANAHQVDAMVPEPPVDGLGADPKAARQGRNIPPLLLQEFLQPAPGGAMR